MTRPETGPPATGLGRVPVRVMVGVPSGKGMGTSGHDEGPVAVAIGAWVELLVSLCLGMADALECYRRSGPWSSGCVGCGGALPVGEFSDFVEVDTDSSSAVVAVVGEFAAVDPDPDGARLRHGVEGGGVDVGDHMFIMPLPSVGALFPTGAGFD